MKDEGKVLVTKLYIRERWKNYFDNILDEKDMEFYILCRINTRDED